MPEQPRPTWDDLTPDEKIAELASAVRILEGRISELRSLLEGHQQLFRLAKIALAGHDQSIRALAALNGVRVNELPPEMIQ